MQFIYSLFYSTLFVFIHFFISIMNSMIICNWFQSPFFDYSKQFSVEYIEKKTNSITTFIFYSVLNHHFIHFTFSDHFLYSIEMINTDPIYSPYFLHHFINYVKYILLLEFLFYLFHRLSHHSIVYKYIHSNHHKNLTIYPIDAIDGNYLDNIIFEFSLHIPLLIVNLNYYEYLCFYNFYSTGNMIVHSKMITSIHVNHHRYFKRNYCLLFPIYDFIFSTMEIRDD